jgi:hypothetical protein
MTTAQCNAFGGGVPETPGTPTTYQAPGVNRGGGGAATGTAYTTNGSSGIVIISYATSYGLAVATTGSPTQTTVGSNYVYQFTGSGSITF